MASIDRINDLPDSLLHHIMSFLESQEAVQTCVLSKRWKNLWASLPCLCLDLSKFVAVSDDSDSVNKLDLGCPALEVLYLNNCLMNIRVVSFPKLKYLNISSWGKDEWVESIRAPNLVSLELDGFAEVFKETSLEKMPFLMNATISLWCCCCFDAEKCKLLRAVSSVQNLELSGRAIEALIKIGLPRCPTLFNVTILSLRYFCMICHSNEIGDILKRTPNLKKLTLCGDIDKKHECNLEADQGINQGINSMKSSLFQCKNLDEIEVELKCINVGTKQLVNTLVESLAELKITHLILSFHCNWPHSPSVTKLHRFCLSMVQGKNVLTLLHGNKCVVWPK